MRGGGLGGTIIALALMALALPAAAQMGGMGGGMGGMGGGPVAPPSSVRSGEDMLPEVDGSVGGDAQATFDRAEKAFAAKDWLEAIAYYRHITQKFSFNVTLVAAADIRLADIAFERGRWSEARSYYRNFVRFHPRHAQAEYASFRVGLCAFKAIPRSSFIEPPSEERDQVETRNALTQMRDFMQRHPSGAYTAQAAEVVQGCEERLAAHELSVAAFYAQRQQWKGVVMRTAELMRRFPHASLAGDALLLSVEAHMKLNERDEAEKDLALLAALEPQGKRVDKARALLASKAPAKSL